MGPPGVEGDVRKAQDPVCGRDAVFQHRFPHPFAGAADREDPPLPAVLEEIVPQSPRFGQGFIRRSRKDGAVLLHEDRCGGGVLRGFGPAVQHGVGVLTFGDLPGQGRCGLRRLGQHHQPGNADVQPVHHPHIGVRLAPEGPQRVGQTRFTGKTRRFVHDCKGRIFVDDHSLPSSSRALSFSTPAMVLPSLISPLRTIS